MRKDRLYLHVVGATHFAAWERKYFAKHFDLVDHASEGAILFAFGPDALESGARLPAKFRIALLFPGFGLNPYHDLIDRQYMHDLACNHYRVVFANPGPIAQAFSSLPMLHICGFSINVDIVGLRRARKSISSLLHASADYPQKDWRRSERVMRATGLPYEVYPSRDNPVVRKISQKLGRFSKRIGASRLLGDRRIMATQGYTSHGSVIAKYLEHDGFVHVAAEVPPYVDGKYTATLLEAGLSGCILFWHDTLGLGNDFETVFSLPLDPDEAAAQIILVKDNIDVARHSALTSEEVLERSDPEKIMRFRYQVIRQFS